MKDLTLRFKSRGFTLIEVLTASVILSAVFFAILSLVSNNTRQAVTISHSETLNDLSFSSKSCIESFGYTYLRTLTGAQSLSFWSGNLGCFTGSYNTNLSFSGISLAYSSSAETGSTTYWSYFSQNSVTDTSVSIKMTLTDGNIFKDYSFLVAP